VFPVRFGQTYGVEFQIEVRTTDNVQSCDSYINIPLSQTFISCLLEALICVERDEKL
jgi:hypothetical protein